MEWVRYQGLQGKAYPLAISEEHVAVRTDGRPLTRAALSKEAWAAARNLVPLFHLPAAGVEVHRVVATRGVRAARDRARAALREERGVRFAGRVLCHPESREPVLYTENVFVKFRDDQAPSRCRRLIAEHGLEIKREIPYLANGYFLEGPEGIGMKIFTASRNLLEAAGVEYCHPELVWETGYRMPLQWHLAPRTIGEVAIDAHASVEAAWVRTRGKGAVIAVIDDGFDIDHEELASPGKVVAPRDITEDSDDPRPGDRNDHGTPCAGVACADGLHQASGVAPAARLMPVRLASGLGSQDEADAIQYAAENGADVISCSWGPKDGNWRDPDDPLHLVSHPLPDSTRLALDWAVTHGRGGRGSVLCWAAGNGNESVDLDGYASAPQVMAVAASNDEGKRAPYSDKGEAVWCCFPSNDFDSPRTTGIWTIDRSGRSGFNPGRSSLGDRKGRYTNRFQGTSSACPGVAGVAALVLSVNPALTWREVREVLRDTADRIDEERSSEDGGYRQRDDGTRHSPLYGYGRVNAARAVERAAAMAAPPAATRLLRGTRATRGGSPPAAAHPTLATVRIRVATGAPQTTLWLDGRPLSLDDDGEGRLRLEAGVTYLLSWYVEGPPETPYRIAVDADGGTVEGSLPVEQRIARGETKAAGTRKLSVRAS